MQAISSYLSNIMVNEHLIDSCPQMIFIMGLPASGKSTFINKHLPKYFPSLKQTRTLDSDIQLHKRQKQNAMGFAKSIYGVSQEEFDRIVADTTTAVNTSKAQSQLGINFNISTDWDWINQHKDMKYNDFQASFLKDFFKKDWAINFEPRPVAKMDYKELMHSKLSPEEFEGMESFNNNDVVIPITGDNFDKLIKIINEASDSYVPSVVYLDMPVEVSVAKDEGRRQKEGRGVGRELIESKAPGIEYTWKKLSSGEFKKNCIYKLLHFEYVPETNGWGSYKLKKEYVNTQLIKEFLPKLN
jgi:hypothetical protein